MIRGTGGTMFALWKYIQFLRSEKVTNKLFKKELEDQSRKLSDALTTNIEVVSSSNREIDELVKNNYVHPEAQKLAETAKMNTTELIVVNDPV